MKPLFLGYGAGCLSASALSLYAIFTEHTPQELTWALISMSIFGFCIFAIGVALGPKRARG